MYKRFFITLFTCATTLVSFSQKIPATINKAMTDPDRASNSAKADVYIQDKKVISDVVPADKKVITTTEKKKKTKRCKRKSNK